jgi:hypothetical protein
VEETNRTKRSVCPARVKCERRKAKSCCGLCGRVLRLKTRAQTREVITDRNNKRGCGGRRGEARPRGHSVAWRGLVRAVTDLI